MKTHVFFVMKAKSDHMIYQSQNTKIWICLSFYPWHAEFIVCFAAVSYYCYLCLTDSLFAGLVMGKMDDNHQNHPCLYSNNAHGILSQTDMNSDTTRPRKYKITQINDSDNWFQVIVEVEVVLHPITLSVEFVVWRCLRS
jgi:hypothetical protein